MEIVEVNKRLLEDLVDDSICLNALYVNGVDNWEYYDDALKDYRDAIKNTKSYIITPSIEDMIREINTETNGNLIIQANKDNFVCKYSEPYQGETFTGETVRDCLSNCLEWIHSR